jgi:two-component system chemotaxis response regulator CheY
MKALITDDSQFMRAILKNALMSVPGVDFFEAENGDVAVELFKQYHPDITFLDIIMPVKNGIMALEEIRQIDPTAKIVIVTSVGQEEMLQKARELNANGFVTKPFQGQQIQEIFNQLIGPTT